MLEWIDRYIIFLGNNSFSRFCESIYSFIRQKHKVKVSLNIYYCKSIGYSPKNDGFNASKVIEKEVTLKSTASKLSFIWKIS